MPLTETQRSFFKIIYVMFRHRLFRWDFSHLLIESLANAIGARIFSPWPWWRGPLCQIGSPLFLSILFPSLTSFAKLPAGAVLAYIRSRSTLLSNGISVAAWMQQKMKNVSHRFWIWISFPEFLHLHASVIIPRNEKIARQKMKGTTKTRYYSHGLFVQVMSQFYMEWYSLPVLLKAHCYRAGPQRI